MRACVKNWDFVTKGSILQSKGMNWSLIPEKRECGGIEAFDHLR